MDKNLRYTKMLVVVLSRILVFLFGFIVGGSLVPLSEPPLETSDVTSEVVPTAPAPTEETSANSFTQGTLPFEPVNSVLFGESITTTTKPALFKTRIDPNKINWYGSYRVKAMGTVTTQAGGYEFDREFLAKLLYCEARGSNWEGQVFTCSAILNYCDEHERSLWAVGHDADAFSVAPWVDGAKPKEMQYEVVDYVLSGGRIEDICYFRTKRYHSFGVPVCEVDGHYFSMRAN